ncbi:MAG: hypothetical protein Q8K63_09185 [Acidimicrobiales bacterium]|nr:hypothetical protein [Acidimicrobiales bacterium]
MRLTHWWTGTAIAVGAVALSSGSAQAGHDHYMVTPNGDCHQVAQGQTAISDPTHGGYHQYHDHVHSGATGGSTASPFQLGDGHSVVFVYRDDCVAP